MFLLQLESNVWRIIWADFCHFLLACLDKVSLLSSVGSISKSPEATCCRSTFCDNFRWRVKYMFTASSFHFFLCFSSFSTTREWRAAVQMGSWDKLLSPLHAMSESWTRRRISILDCLVTAYQPFGCIGIPCCRQVDPLCALYCHEWRWIQHVLC